MRLRDRIGGTDFVTGPPTGQTLDTPPGKSQFSDYCKRFNNGRCNLGSGCRYEHRCQYCHKFGHGILVCRKLTFDKERVNKRNGKRENGNGSHHNAKGNNN